jgi:hypothetical protein
MKQTLENNKLIAEFMGMQDTDLGWYDSVEAMSEYACQMVGGNTFEELQYDRSWDWLMPVVEKIETLGYTFEKNYQQIDRDWQCLIVKGNDILHQEFDRKSLNAAHYVVVEFIKQQKKQD